MATAARNKRGPEIPDALLRELKENVASRQVSQGIALLDENAELFTALDPEQKNAAAFVGYLAQWVDIGYREPELLEKLLGRFSRAARARSSVLPTTTLTRAPTRRIASACTRPIVPGPTTAVRRSATIWGNG